MGCCNCDGQWSAKLKSTPRKWNCQRHTWRIIACSTTSICTVCPEHKFELTTKWYSLAMPNDDGSSPAFTGQELLSEDGITVALTYEILQPLAVMAHVKSPKAGAVVLFAGKPP